jgi:uncharacterized lipoprotein YajG
MSSLARRPRKGNPAMTMRHLLVAASCTMILAACQTSQDICDHQHQVPQAECAALRTFYESTGGAAWKDQRM